ncbi:TerB family tellurite resistance protein [Aeromonas sp.]|uniref:tellurite resistance TerB family protein n=1 Tax=Aeromonas sp. TaxID=647 RepID=UPI00259120C5|nr:TerB family tellurite resistance protein [Aeromonas sp.]MCX7132500.1 TerB family tellurite resistance protein [Aeromonas sp.]
MFGIGKLFGKKAAAARGELKKMENRDLMEAVVGGCMLIAFADGECEESELKTIESLLRTSKALEGFGHEVTDTMNRFTERLHAGYRVARLEIMREIGDVKSNRNEAEDVLVAMLTVALADGEIEPEEQKELDAVATTLGLRLADYV